MVKGFITSRKEYLTVESGVHRAVKRGFSVGGTTVEQQWRVSSSGGFEETREEEELREIEVI